MNIGRFQVLYWPRWKLCFAMGARFRAYRWVIYIWPIEVRCFARLPR